MASKPTNKGIDRRSFLGSAITAGAGMMLAAGTAKKAMGGESAPVSDKLNVAMIGTGSQGLLLLTHCMKMSGLRFKAICDIWENYNLSEASKILKVMRHEHNTYVDYREMLDNEKDLDAVIIATPDCWHAEQTVACLEAGLNVYCEAPMAATLEGARKMTAAAEKTGKLLQIGRQRRSNPKYNHCAGTLLNDVKLLGRITAIDGQWNRSVQPERGWPKRAPIDETTLKQHGYESMDQFRNWRWFKKLSAGPMGQLDGHQIDVYNWFLRVLPTAVLASGGVDYYPPETREWYDTVMAIFEYQTSTGSVRALYQICNTNGNLGYYEKFLGDEGAMVISEQAGLVNLFREATAPDWERWVGLEFLKRTGPAGGEGDGGAVMSVTETVQPVHYTVPVEFTDPYHKPHLENFLAAVRGQAQLTCPAAFAYPTTVAVFKTYEAIESGKKIELTAGDYAV